MASTQRGSPSLKTSRSKHRRSHHCADELPSPSRRVYSEYQELPTIMGYWAAIPQTNDLLSVRSSPPSDTQGNLVSHLPIVQTRMALCRNRSKLMASAASQAHVRDRHTNELALITSSPPIEKRVGTNGSDLWIKIDFSYGENNRALNAVRRRQPLTAVIV